MDIPSILDTAKFRHLVWKAQMKFQQRFQVFKDFRFQSMMSLRWHTMGLPIISLLLHTKNIFCCCNDYIDICHTASNSWWYKFGKHNGILSVKLYWNSIHLQEILKFLYCQWLSCLICRQPLINTFYFFTTGEWSGMIFGLEIEYSKV